MKKLLLVSLSPVFIGALASLALAVLDEMLLAAGTADHGFRYYELIFWP